MYLTHHNYLHKDGKLVPSNIPRYLIIPKIDQIQIVATRKEWNSYLDQQINQVFRLINYINKE